MPKCKEVAFCKYSVAININFKSKLIFEIRKCIKCKFQGVWVELKMIKCFASDNFRQSIMEKAMYKKFFKERFAADFSKISRGTAKICLLHGWSSGSHQFQAFKRFS